MFFFGDLPWYNILMFFIVTALLILWNEITRRSKGVAFIGFIVLPAVLTIFVWPSTAGAGSSTGTWFHWVKVYSALAGCIGFACLRYIDGAAEKKWVLCFPPLILAINILEAVIRDFEVSGISTAGIVDGVWMHGGTWNILNGLAGLINILGITGWFGIYISKTKSKDMIWPDMIWPWIIAYDVWNIAYVYNCVSDHAFYAGVALNLAPTIAAFFIKKGAWLQHRAHTLAAWMMFTMSYPAFVSTSEFAVKSSHNDTAMLVLSSIALIINIAVFGHQIYRTLKYKTNVYGGEVYAGTPAYLRAKEEEK